MVLRTFNRSFTWSFLGNPFSTAPQGIYPPIMHGFTRWRISILTLFLAKNLRSATQVSVLGWPITNLLWTVQFPVLLILPYFLKAQGMADGQHLANYLSRMCTGCRKLQITHAHRYPVLYSCVGLLNRSSLTFWMPYFYFNYLYWNYNCILIFS